MMAKNNSHIISVLIISVFMFMLNPYVSYAQSVYDNSFPVRVGIFYGSVSKTSYAVSGTNIQIYDSSKKVIETGVASLNVSLSPNIYISSMPESSYEDAMQSAKKYLDKALVYYNNGEFYAGSTIPNADLISASGSKAIFTLDDGRVIACEGSKDIGLSSGDSVTGLENVRYRGKLNFYIKGSSLYAINEVGMQEYLYGVVPKEMVSSWEMEALKAQAIVAKNYTITNYSKHSADGFNVCKSTHCQVYGAYSAEQEKTNRSVDETEGMVMMYNGAPAEAYFHSSSGGRTESIGNMWNYGLDYMSGVKDPYSTGTPYDNWEATLSASEIEQALLRYNYNVGTVVGIKILEVSQNDRVMKLGVLGTSGMKILEKDAIRTVLGSSKFKSTYFTLTDTAGQSSSTSERNRSDIRIQDNGLKNAFDKLDSFVSTRISDGTQDFVSGSSYVFSGKGFGHGIGLSQYGANNMAKEGNNFKDIISYYFKGVTIG